jgi:hypothetical protein
MFDGRKIDQHIFSLMYLSGDNNMVLDCYCDVFQTFFMTEPNWFIKEPQLYNTITGTTPVVLHGNGKSDFKRWTT